MTGLRHAFEAIVDLPPAERKRAIVALAFGDDDTRVLRAAGFTTVASVCSWCFVGRAGATITSASIGFTRPRGCPCAIVDLGAVVVADVDNRGRWQ